MTTYVCPNPDCKTFVMDEGGWQCGKCGRLMVPEIAMKVYCYCSQPATLVADSIGYCKDHSPAL